MLASRFVLEWNHWIAFVLLIFLGGRMIIEGFRGADDEDEEPRRRHGFWLLVTTAIATSPDAMAVGVGLAFLQVNIIATALAIGCATLIMSTLGMMVGRFIGSIIGKKSGNSRRAGADRHRRPDPLDALPRLIRTLPEVNIKVRLAVEHFFFAASVCQTSGFARQGQTASSAIMRRLHHREDASDNTTPHSAVM